jgi:hypothetical protein
MEASILIPHFKNGETTAYSIAQILRHRGNHNLQILVINNNAGDGSEDYLYPFRGEINYIEYPKNRLQSHGCAFDWVIENGFVDNEIIITSESDAFPTNSKCFDHYERLVNEGYDCGVNVMRLSGGVYPHPCGSFYKKLNWVEAKFFFEKQPYSYFPNISVKEGFESHCMVHDDILDDFLNEPQDYIELGRSYWGLNREQILEKCKEYSPVGKGVFHNGIGAIEESLSTYGYRTIEEESAQLFNIKRKIINRVGAEPGQMFGYWHYASKKKVFEFGNEIKWLPNRENQQQQYTINDAGWKHLWAGSSFLDMANTPMSDVYEFKKNQIEQLYNSLPDNQKI